MKHKKPNYNLLANYEKLSLTSATALLNDIEPQHDHLQLFKISHERIKRGENLISFLLLLRAVKPTSFISDLFINSFFINTPI